MFITAVPITKLFSRGEGDNGGHVLLYYEPETTSRGLCRLVCPSRTSERGVVHGAFSTSVFQHQCITPHQHWRRRVGRIENHDRYLSTLVLIYFAHRMEFV
jgi:hypothetical protein